MDINDIPTTAVVLRFYVLYELDLNKGYISSSHLVILLNFRTPNETPLLTVSFSPPQVRASAINLVAM